MFYQLLNFSFNLVFSRWSSTICFHHHCHNHDHCFYRSYKLPYKEAKISGILSHFPSFQEIVFTPPTYKQSKYCCLTNWLRKNGALMTKMVIMMSRKTKIMNPPNDERMVPQSLRWLRTQRCLSPLHTSSHHVQNLRFFNRNEMKMVWTVLEIHTKGELLVLS